MHSSVYDVNHLRIFKPNEEKTQSQLSGSNLIIYSVLQPKIKVDCVRMRLNQAVSKDGTGRPMMDYFCLH